MEHISYTETLIAGALSAVDRVWAQKGRFFSGFFAVALLSYAVLYAIDFVPEAPEQAPVVAVHPSRLATTTTPASERVVARYPERIIIKKIDIDVDVLNPVDDSISTLDSALLEGAVRYPGSADFRDTGTMLLFGHSSYLPTVHNQNFKAFNGIQKLVWGDEVIVRSDDTEYVYRVEKVYKAAASDTSVDIGHVESRLILVTCNSFGSKDDRFVLEASFVSSRPL